MPMKDNGVIIQETLPLIIIESAKAKLARVSPPISYSFGYLRNKLNVIIKANKK